MPLYTTKSGRELTAVIFTGDNKQEIFDLMNTVPNLHVSNGDAMFVNDFVLGQGDYLVYDENGFVEIMAAENF